MDKPALAEQEGEAQAQPAEMNLARLGQIMRAAVKQNASDVHFKTGEPVLVRIDGALHTVNAPPLKPDDVLRLFESLRPPHLAEVDVRELQEADFSFSVQGTGRFRANVFRQRGSLAMVVRVLPVRIPGFGELNLPDVLGALAEERRGMVLVTGATGTGKSTTLAAMINHINQRRSTHIITIEDPIEVLYQNNRSSVIQREVGTDTRSFAVALRAALRQDPDVIMIGEMRDTETIDIALKAAETGHLVFSTAHTTDASKTIQRLLSVFPPSEQAMVRIRLSESLRGVVSQRLLPRADGKGLIPAIEVMVATRVIQECIRTPDRSLEIPEYITKGRSYGMQTFDQHLISLLRQGKITRDVALSAATSPADLKLQLSLGTEEEDALTIEHTSYSDMPMDQEQSEFEDYDGDVAAAAPRAEPQGAARPAPPSGSAPLRPGTQSAPAQKPPAKRGLFGRGS